MHSDSIQTKPSNATPSMTRRPKPTPVKSYEFKDWAMI